MAEPETSSLHHFAPSNEHSALNRANSGKIQGFSMLNKNPDLCPSRQPFINYNNEGISTQRRIKDEETFKINHQMSFSSIKSAQEKIMNFNTVKNPIEL